MAGASLKAGLAYGADGRTLYFLGRLETQEDRNDLYAISALATGGTASIVGDAPRFKGAPIVDPGGRVLLHLVAPRTFARIHQLSIGPDTA